MDLIKPYASNSLVNNIIESNDLENISLRKCSEIKLSDYDLIDFERIADGSFTPIDGLMNKAEVESILSCNKLTNNIYFPLPIIKTISEEIYKKQAETIILYSNAGEKRGYIAVSEYYEFEKNNISNYLFGTNSLTHPGVKKINSMTNYFVAGKVYMSRDNYSEEKTLCASPKEIRNKIKSMGLKSITGFHTRNIPHLAHEYLQRVALEISDGLLIHPIIGWKKKGDFTPKIVMDAYNYLKDNYYPMNKVILSGLRLSTYYAGPREAPFHAIIRQNYGCTHFIVGRDHAGVDGFYEKYQAHQLIEQVYDHLDINVLLMKGPYYCQICQIITTENSCNHNESKKEQINMSDIRDAIINKTKISDKHIRKDLIDHVLTINQLFIK